MSLTEPTREIETKHLTLRTPWFCDCERIATLANDRDIVTMTGRMPWPYGLDDAKAFVAAVQSQDARHNATFLIELKNEGPIGVIGLFMANDPVPEIGYWIGKPYWGRGLASEALKATTHWAHGHWQRRALLVPALASASACPSLPPSASVSAEPGSESAVATSKPAGEEQSDRDRLLQSDALSERKLHEVAEASASRIE